jgi:hypothetical protein
MKEGTVPLPARWRGAVIDKAKATAFGFGRLIFLLARLQDHLQLDLARQQLRNMPNCSQRA